MTKICLYFELGTAIKCMLKILPQLKSPHIIAKKLNAHWLEGFVQIVQYSMILMPKGWYHNGGSIPTDIIFDWS